MNTTTVAPETQKAPPLEKQTTVGNYFVSNYPPFSFWKPEFVPEVYAAMDRAPSTINHQPSTTLGLYVHIPFCRKRCHFCYFKVYTDKDAAAIRSYIDTVLKELTAYARQPVIGGRKPRFIYFGGGTPSYLSESQLKFLSESMKALLPWDAAEEITFEAAVLKTLLLDQSNRFIKFLLVRYQALVQKGNFCHILSLRIDVPKIPVNGGRE